MPELPEVETVLRGMTPHVTGATIQKLTLRRPDLRIPFPSDMHSKLEGAVITRTSRRAKYLMFHLDNGWNWITHLGMSGRFTIEPTTHEPLKHDHALIELTANPMCRQHVGTSPERHEVTTEQRAECTAAEHNILLVFHDPRRFGLMELVKDSEQEQHKLFNKLAPEPLSNQFNEAYLAEQLAKRKAPIKQILMDNHVVVGVGNIYASETLYRSRIHPTTPALKTRNHAGELVSNIRDVLSEAIESGGSTLRDFVGAGSNAGYFQHNFDVYGREGEPCNHCASPIQKIVQANRASFFCGKCQTL